MGKVWENQELKEELENAQSTENNIESDEDVNSIRAKTSCHLHQILSNQFNTKKQKINIDNNSNDSINKNKNDKLTQLCNDIETQIFIKSNRNINKNYMEHSRNLLFNLRQNKSLQFQLINKQINARQFVIMKYTELAPQKLAKQRKLHKKEELKRIKSISDDTHDWIECAVQCTKCKYKMKKMLFESTKSEIFGGASSKQQNVDMI